MTMIALQLAAPPTPKATSFAASLPNGSTVTWELGETREVADEVAKKLQADHPECFVLPTKTRRRKA